MLSCESNEKKSERLAKVYCSSCHAYTKPELLDKKTWQKSVLPEMSFRMGLSTDPINLNMSYEKLMAALATIPATPLVSAEEYQLIEKFFLTHAPDSLVSPPAAVTQPLTQFEPHRIGLFDVLPQFSMLQVGGTNTIFAGTRDKKLYVLNPAFSIKDTIELNSPPSHIEFHDSKILISEMGIMDPNDEAKGQLVEIDLVAHTSRVLIDSIKRPVYFEEADFNEDGLIDYVVCSFGNYSGQLEIFEATKNGSYQTHKIDNTPGARKVIVRDFDGDGKKDIVALMTQGDERIMLHLNKGNFRFQSKALLRFPAVYGSSYFEVHDFNGDGHFDILYTNGDNSDYSPVLKPYHGVRIFLNDGKNSFEESWSYPMHGASWALARDYDQDGDIDIAAISFFPDFKNSPDQSFIYFENKKGTFMAHTTMTSAYGRWIVMDAADVDRDGDTDILLGALDFQPNKLKDFATWNQRPTAILFLENKLK